MISPACQAISASEQRKGEGSVSVRVMESSCQFRLARATRGISDRRRECTEQARGKDDESAKRGFDRDIAAQLRKSTRAASEARRMEHAVGKGENNHRRHKQDFCEQRSPVAGTEKMRPRRHDE